MKIKILMIGFIFFIAGNILGFIDGVRSNISRKVIYKAIHIPVCKDKIPSYEEDFEFPNKPAPRYLIQLGPPQTP